MLQQGLCSLTKPGISTIGNSGASAKEALNCVETKILDKSFHGGEELPSSYSSH